MTTQIDFLKWCKTQGIENLPSSNIRTYLKNEQPTAMTPQKITSKQNLHLNKEDQALAARHIADKCDTLQSLKEAVHSFEGCLLKKTATNTVFSAGNPHAKVMLIGEAPGANEDLTGIPFCGESGKLLDKILKSINLVRESSIYITNSIFWRPPGNRKPTDQEIKCCLPFVEKHIAILKPALIILAGSVALQTLFGDKGSISKQRQKILSYENRYLDQAISTAVIFHPSYLLRQPSQKKLVWHDMLFIKNFLAAT